MKFKSDTSALISVIIPIYNVDKYLDKCIKSVVEQSYKNLEIILVDDGSPDNCPKICDKWKEQDKRIVVEHTKNYGVSHARNTGLELSSGEYVLFIDGDDFIDKNMISLLYENIKSSHSEISICNYYIYDDFSGFYCNKEKIAKIMNKQQFIDSIFNFKTVSGFVWNKLYRKNYILNNQIKFDEKIEILEDLIFNCDISKVIEKVCYIDKPLYYYVQRKESVLHNETIDHKINSLIAQIRIINFLESQLNEKILLEEKINFIVEVEEIKYYLKNEKKQDSEEMKIIYKYYEKCLKEKIILKTNNYKKVIKYYIIKFVPKLYFKIKK